MNNASWRIIEVRAEQVDDASPSRSVPHFLTSSLLRYGCVTDSLTQKSSKCFSFHSSVS